MSAITTRLLATAIDVGTTVSPRRGGAFAASLLVRAPRSRPVDERDEQTMDAARSSSLRIPGIARRGLEIRSYEWGDGDDVVALAHGWHGRASQFATLVRELVSEGYRVVAFDAPGHGASPGRRTYLVDWVDAFRALDERYDGLHALVGHSFGGAGALVAATAGVRVDRVVTAAAPAGTDLLFDRFQQAVGHSDRSAGALRSAFVERHLGGDAGALDRLSPHRSPVPDGVGVLAFHDETDPVVPFTELQRLRDASPQTFPVVTTGIGHSAMLRADIFLDGVLGFLAPPARGDRLPRQVGDRATP